MKISKEHFKKIQMQNILVVGDLMLDVYLHGFAHRISPEAPVPVVLADKKEYLPGGAANVMNNISQLGCQTWGAGFLGKGAGGDKLESLLSSSLESVETLLRCDLSTIQKTRLLANGQHVVRYDEESDYRKVTDSQKLEMIGLIECLLETKSFSCVVLSDYNKGTLNSNIVDMIKSKFNGPIICDIKPANKSMFYKTFCIAPNLLEAKLMCGNKDDNRDPEHMARKIKSEIGLETIIITLSDHGMLIIDQNDECLVYDAYTKKSNLDPNSRLDVTGAGDTVLSILSACIGAKFSFQEAAWIANVAAGIVVKKVGTSVCSFDELFCELSK